jgi:Predicted ATP-dependent serine protease
MYKCKNCGAASIKWVGKCPECQSYNTMEIALPEAKSTKTVRLYDKPPENSPVTPIEAESSKALSRIKTGINEFDVSVGSGLVNGQSVLIGGDPGIGKSTLMLQISNRLASPGSGLKILYISTEESLNQLLLRAKRLGLTSGNLFLLSLNDINEILYTVNNGDYDFIIIDSIQRVTMPDSETAYGSPNSLREIAHEITSACLKKKLRGIFCGTCYQRG